MSMQLKDTNAGQIASAILKARRNLGTASGLAFTLVVVTDSRRYAKVFDAAMEAGREHPSRILIVVQSKGKATGLDAEIHTDGGVPGDVVTLRMSGELDSHADSVVLPLLLPDSPVVVWWPHESPLDPGQDSLGILGTRRITDAAGVPDPVNALLVRAKHHSPGDTDLTWTRLTPWRALLAAALDQYHTRITGATVEANVGNAPAQLMAAWLQDRLHCDVEVKRTTESASDGGIGAVRLHTLAGDVALARQTDSGLAAYLIPGQPPRMVALARRDINQLITEELRRMDADDIFEQSTRTMLDRDAKGLVARSRRRSADGSADAKAAGTSTSALVSTPARAKVVPADEPQGSSRLDSPERAAKARREAQRKRTETADTTAVDPEDSREAHQEAARKAAKGSKKKSDEDAGTSDSKKSASKKSTKSSAAHDSGEVSDS